MCMAAKSIISNPFGFLFIVVGIAVIAADSYNYFNGGRISIAFAVGLAIIAIGLFVGRRGARQ